MKELTDKIIGWTQTILGSTALGTGLSLICQNPKEPVNYFTTLVGITNLIYGGKALTKYASDFDTLIDVKDYKYGLRAIRLTETLCGVDKK